MDDEVTKALRLLSSGEGATKFDDLISGAVDEIMGEDLFSGDSDDFAGDDISGDEYAGDEYSGDDDDVVGAVRRAIRKRRGMGRRRGGRPNPMRMNRNIGQTLQMGPGHDYILPFASSSLAAGASGNAVGSPQGLFSPYIFEVSANIASSFDITEIKIGTETMFATTGQFDAQAFSTNRASRLVLSLRSVNPNENITITVTNTSAAAAVFRAHMIGRLKR